ncbi:MAG: hypothetical protein ABF826_04475, partial [Komagataeibacter saccharivorans]
MAGVFFAMVAMIERVYGHPVRTGGKRLSTHYRYSLVHMVQTTRKCGAKKYREIMVLLDRIELSTSPLPREC